MDTHSTTHQPPLPTLPSISNIFDWLSESQAVDMLRRLAARLAPGGAIIMRHETLDAGFLQRVVAAAGSLRSEPGVDFALHRADRALLTRDLAAAWRV